MQMVGECPGHEFHRGLRERPGGIAVVPADVYGDLAHREAGGKCAGILINHRLEAHALADISRAADPLVSELVAGLSDVSQVKVAAAPQAIRFSLQRFIYQPARNRSRGAV